MGNVDIFDVIEGAYKVFKSKIKKKTKLFIKIEANISICNIFGSKGKLEQVFINLFQNSIDAVSELKKIKLLISKFINLIEEIIFIFILKIMELQYQ